MKPFQNTRLAKYLRKRVLQLRPKTQAEIAEQAGYANANMITMLKQGAVGLPLDRVGPLAKALECDPVYLLHLALEQKVGSTEAQALMTIMSSSVTRNEMRWVHAIREASDVSDPPLTRRGRAAISGVFGK